MNRSHPIVSLMAVLLAFQSLAWLAAWKGFQVSARRQATEMLNLSDERLSRKVFTKAFVQSLKVGEREIMLEGRLFDYKTLEERGDTLVLALYHDSKEETLLDWLGRSVGHEKNDPKQSGALAQWLAGLLSAHFLIDEPLHFYDHMAEQGHAMTFWFLGLQTQFKPGILCPPPDSGPVFSFCCFGG